MSFVLGVTFNIIMIVYNYTLNMFTLNFWISKYWGITFIRSFTLQTERGEYFKFLVHHLILYNNTRLTIKQDCYMFSRGLIHT